MLQKRIVPLLLVILWGLGTSCLLDGWTIIVHSPAFVSPQYRVSYAVLMFILAVLQGYWLYRYYRKHRTRVGLMSWTLRDVAIIMGYYVLDLVANYFFYVYLSSKIFQTEFGSFIQFVPAIAAPQRIRLILTAGDPLMVLMYFMAVLLVAPVLEELLYRGILGGVFLRRYSFVTRLLVTSVLFATIHVAKIHNVSQWLGYLFGAMILYYAYERRQNLWDSILVHSLYNGLIAFFIYYLPEFLLR